MLSKNQSVTYSQMQKLFDEAFGKDLGLVDAEHEHRLTFDLEPWPIGRYSLTTFMGRPEQFFSEQLAGQTLALAIGCMDKRYAHPFFKWVEKKSKGQIVVPILIGAGIAQCGNEERAMALKQTIQFFCDQFNISKIWASGHAHNCGGLSFIHHAGRKNVTKGLGCKPGSRTEISFVQGQIVKGVNNLVPKSHLGKVQRIMVTEKRGRPHIFKFR